MLPGTPSEFSVNIEQTLIKFKSCVNMQAGSSATKNSIRYKDHCRQEGYGAWFMKPFTILKTREFCQPEKNSLDPERETQGATSKSGDKESRSSQNTVSNASGIEKYNNEE